MKLHAEKGSGNYIQSVTGEAVLIDGMQYRTPLMVTPERLITNWLPPALDQLTPDDFQVAMDLEPELILLGTGTTHRFVSNHLMTAIMKRGVGFEIMANAAACRTYNILSAEDRRVLVALLRAGPGPLRP